MTVAEPIHSEAIARSLPRAAGSKHPSSRLSVSRLPWLWTICISIIAITLIPLGYLVLRASGSAAENIAYLLSPRTLTIIGNSLVLTVSVVAAAALIGVPFAWLTTRTALPFRRFWLVLGLLPMVIPSFIGALTLVAAFGPAGYLQQALSVLGVRQIPQIYGFFGAWLAITLFTYPYFALPVRAALLNIDTSAEEAARSLGYSRWRVFHAVTLPMLRPALAAGALLTALYTLSDFGAVAVMRYNAFTRAIYVTYNSSFDRNRAAILALMLVILTLTLVWMERRAHSKAHTYRAAVPRRAPPVALGRWKWVSLLFCAFLVGLGVILPVGVLLGWAVNPHVTSAVDVNLFELSWNTTSSSLLAALVVGIAALPLALFSLRTRSAPRRMLVSLSYIGNGLPGIVIGLALVFLGANALPALYQTLPILILGYAVRFLPYGVSATHTALNGISPALDEAARGLGLAAFERLRRVTVPLAKTGIIAGMALVFLNALKELPTTLMLAPIGYKTLATRIWTASESGTLALVGLPGLVLIGVSCLGLALMLWRDHTQHKGSR